VNYHAEHHAMMYVPCFRLPKAHRMLEEKGALQGTAVEPSYGRVLQRVVTAAAPA
jgi:fatty acid desaturase